VIDLLEHRVVFYPSEVEVLLGGSLDVDHAAFSLSTW
jgi:hypothetical protein